MTKTIFEEMGGTYRQVGDKLSLYFHCSSRY